jgi:hypothetical protein
MSYLGGFHSNYLQLILRSALFQAWPLRIIGLASTPPGVHLFTDRSRDRTRALHGSNGGRMLLATGRRAVRRA